MPKIKSCEECKGACCKDVAIEIDEPEDFDDFEDIKWLIAHENVNVYLDNEHDWLVEFKTRCKFLDEKNRCKIYHNRYKVCGEHDPISCVSNGNGRHHKMIFRNERDVDKYMKKIGFYKNYKSKKKKMNGSRK
jgi:Fe-S-cluster containining protein